MSILVYIDANQDVTPKNYAFIGMWPMTQFSHRCGNQCIWELPTHLTIMSERGQLNSTYYINCQLDKPNPKSISL